ncbi:NnrS family protein [Rhodoferax sp.]|uniref:NnrS family protein n=1 Tax=Rhodoferax sp. TaxID=50421 RepID=UPI0034525B1E
MSSIKTESLPLFSDAGAAINQPQGWPFLRLGFRPFYVAGALAAALLVPLWLVLFLGATPFTPAVPALLWHAHEMLFGFAVAVIIGFLMTAGKNWTGLATPRGPLLGALALLWLAARLAALGSSALLYALLDVALLPLVALIFTRLLWRAKNRRNLPLAGILMALATANAVFHLAAAGMLAVSALVPLYAGLALIIMIECVIAGRVIPAFTMAANPGLRLEASSTVERWTLGLSALGLLLWVVFPASWFSAGALLAASGLHGRRLGGWQPGKARGRPILWILHAAYAWIPVGLFLLALAQMGWVAATVGIHALALGATGGLIIGMMTRTARGHTGRPLAVSRTEVLAYGLVMLAALVRVGASLLPTPLYPGLLVLAATAWSLAFAIYLWQYTPWLMQTRLDGKDG